MKPASVIIMDEHPIVQNVSVNSARENSNIQVVLKTDDSRTAQNTCAHTWSILSSGY